MASKGSIGDQMMSLLSSDMFWLHRRLFTSRHNSHTKLVFDTLLWFWAFKSKKLIWWLLAGLVYFDIYDPFKRDVDPNRFLVKKQVKDASTLNGTS